MRRTKRVLGSAGIVCLALLGFWMVNPICACVPIEYAEVALADLPPEVGKMASRDHPRLVPERAWLYGVMLSSNPRIVHGYLVRGRVPGGWWARDVKIPYTPESSTAATVELQPIP